MGGSVLVKSVAFFAVLLAHQESLPNLHFFLQNQHIHLRMKTEVMTNRSWCCLRRPSGSTVTGRRRTWRCSTPEPRVATYSVHVRQVRTKCALHHSSLSWQRRGFRPNELLLPRAR